MFRDIILEASSSRNISPFSINSLSEFQSFITESADIMEAETDNRSFLMKIKKIIQKIFDFFKNFYEKLKAFILGIFKKNEEFKNDNVIKVEFGNKNVNTGNKNVNTDGSKMARVINMDKVKNLKLTTYAYNPDFIGYSGLEKIYEDVDRTILYAAKLNEFQENNIPEAIIKELHLDYTSIYLRYIFFIIEYEGDWNITVEQIEKYIDEQLHGGYKKITIPYNMQDFLNRIDECEKKLKQVVHNQSFLKAHLENFKKTMFRSLEDGIKIHKTILYRAYANAIRNRVTAFINAVTFVYKKKIDILVRQMSEYKSFITYARKVMSGAIEESAYINDFDTILEVDVPQFA